MRYAADRKPQAEAVLARYVPGLMAHDLHPVRVKAWRAAGYDDLWFHVISYGDELWENMVWLKTLTVPRNGKASGRYDCAPRVGQ